MTVSPSFSLGIEEEYLLVDLATRELVRDPPPALLAACERELGSRVSPEFLRSQIEVQTGICTSAAAAKTELLHLRRSVAEVAKRYGMAPIAASTHPSARHAEQRHTDRDRYNALHEDLQAVARRLVICGMHVHVGIEDDDLKIDLMNQVSYFLPHLLALSTSSPFWQGEDTGLKSYRIAVFDEMPRTGIPERFESWGEFQRHTATLVELGIIEDTTKLWWDIRPSGRFPTLEMRIADVCTSIDDGITIACLYRCLLRMLWRLRVSNQRWRIYLRMLIDENRWRAQRYGIDEGLVDFGRRAIVPYAELVDEMLDLVRDDAAHFGCEAELQHARRILLRGTSAHRQLRTFKAATAQGRPAPEALADVVDWLIKTTIADETTEEDPVMVDSRTIDLGTPDGICDTYVAYPSEGGPFPAVLFYMDAPGIRPALHEMADRLASNGYYVLLPNLYYRRGRSPLFDPETIFTPENRPKIFELMGTLTPEIVIRDCAAFMAFLASEEQVKPGPIGVTGYCMGGWMMLRAAAAFPDKIAAGASFHGAMMAPDTPNSPHLGVPKIRAKLYFGMAETDATMPPDQIDRLTAALDAAGTDYEMETYAGTEHGWTVPGRVYHREGSEHHWEKLLGLLDSTLRQP